VYLSHMKPQRLKDARKRLDTVRQEMISEIVGVLPTASDQQLTRVALVFWPEPKTPAGGTSGPKAKIEGRHKKSTVNSVTKDSRKNAAKGRRAVATGERPTLKGSMVLVMGKKTMNAQGVVDALAEKKWLPASDDHRQYISFMLSNNCPDTFSRTEKRGFYRVANGVLQKIQDREQARKAELEVRQSLQDHWGILPTPPTPPTVTNGKKVTAATMWGAIKLGAWSSVTLPELATQMGCNVNQLGSPATKLQREGKLVRIPGKKAVFTVKA